MMAHIFYTAENYDEKREAFINDLPERLKIELYKIIHREYEHKILFFKQVKDENFV